MKHRSAVIAGIVAAAVVALIALFLTADINSDPLAVDTNQLVGKPAPPIETVDSDGRPFSLTDFRGKWVLINFFGTWCPPCVAEHPQLVAFSEEHAATNDAFVVSVPYNDEPAAVREFFENNGGDWQVVTDAESDISINYAVVGMPESYLIDPEGVIVHKFTGGITARQIDAEIAKRS